MKKINNVHFINVDTDEVIFDLKRARKDLKKGYRLRAIGSLKKDPEWVTRTSDIVRFRSRKKFETKNSLYVIAD